jgi:hypothetical protein
MNSLLNIIRSISSQACWALHWLDDRPESKRDVGPLSPMPRSPSTRLSWGSLLLIAASTWLVCLAVNFNGAAQEPPPSESSTISEQTWNLHFQNTDIVQADRVC